MNTFADFRTEVRAFLATELDADTRIRVLGNRALDRAEMVQWHKALHAKGWIAPSWPVEYGGPGWTAQQRLVFDDECALAGAPETLPFGLRMLGPVLMEHGTAQQCETYLPKILDGSHWWCQGFSEPGAGSDLASLSTTARAVDGGFVVSGTKLWTTYAHRASHMFLLARTSREPKKQRGISFMLTPMDAQGVTVRPLYLIDGSHEVNEVVLDEVFVASDGVVGEVGEGWLCAKALLTHERMGAARAGKNRRDLAVLLDTLESQFGQSKHADFVDLALDSDSLTELRDFYLETLDSGSGHGAEAPALKLVTAELTQAISRAAFDNASTEQTDVESAIDVLLNDRKFSIFGGATQVQKDLAATVLWKMGAYK
ncbi:pimeloyl-CoA dehydrogenase large subunit [Rhodococcus sp. KBW08]|uniref:acyl-CoA dehydrogenase family protein n=1 Tax=Rhodococcus sp. KBW08 TaxID=2144188 RepID=UPI000F5B323B|nr:acyl-CoA dehydrogenase family protein [Rhodococcus sp. KBW08]RQO46032.1 pimeloyl-CoA dehydrogenase large subunit [Rhodococcus sp. KBW08]